MTLSIDTTDRFMIKLGLRQDQHVLADINLPVAGKADQQLLPLIEQLLMDQAVVACQISGIEVAIGPGSFTGTRVGVAIANALALAWSVPINGQNDFVEPVYASQPYITTKAP
jgi:tRNA threonylcarbamoyladenosine biosynthesis protein TsaB